MKTKKNKETYGKSAIALKLAEKEPIGKLISPSEAAYADTIRKQTAKEIFAELETLDVNVGITLIKHIGVCPEFQEIKRRYLK